MSESGERTQFSRSKPGPLPLERCEDLGSEFGIVQETISLRTVLMAGALVFPLSQMEISDVQTKNRTYLGCFAGLFDRMYRSAGSRGSAVNH